MITAVTMVRDEEDVIGYTLLHLLKEGVDQIIVADNLSTDHTRDILEALVLDGAPITIVDDPEVAYHQSEMMSQLADTAAEGGADWVIAFDADEIWYATNGTLAETLNDTLADVILATGWDHIATPDDVHLPNPFLRIRNRRAVPQALPKVAFRAHRGTHVHHGNHDVDLDGARLLGLISLRHFQFRSYAQMERKVRVGRAALEATNLHWRYGTHWRVLGSMTDAELWSYWESLSREPDLIEDPAPYR